MSTYGTNFEGEAWLMNDGTTVDFPFKELKVLEGITMDELIPEIQKLGYSNIAFSKEVLDFLFENKQYLEIDKIQNRTLKMMCIPDNYQFKNGQECLNWILWKFFNISLIFILFLTSFIFFPFSAIISKTDFILYSAGDGDLSFFIIKVFLGEVLS